MFHNSVNMIGGSVKKERGEALPGLEPGFWEDEIIRIPSDNHYTIAPPRNIVRLRNLLHRIACKV